MKSDEMVKILSSRTMNGFYRFLVFIFVVTAIVGHGGEKFGDVFSRHPLDLLVDISTFFVCVTGYVVVLFGRKRDGKTKVIAGAFVVVLGATFRLAEFGVVDVHSPAMIYSVATGFLYSALIFVCFVY